MEGLFNRKLKENTPQYGPHSWIDRWSLVGVFQKNTWIYLKNETGNFPLTESSNIWAAATRVQLTLSTCSNVLSDIKLPQLMGEFTPDSNYTSGLFSFAQLTDIPLTSGGVCALEAPLWVSFYCSDWLSSPLSSLAARKWGLIVFHLRGELVECLRFKIQSWAEERGGKRQRNPHFSFNSCRRWSPEEKSKNPVLTPDKASRQALVVGILVNL